MLPILESPGELLKIPMPKPCPVPIKSECLGMEARHQKSVKISRWFQYATIFGNQSHECQVTGLGVFTCIILFLILLTTLQVKCYCYFFFLIYVFYIWETQGEVNDSKSHSSLGLKLRLFDLSMLHPQLRVLSLTFLKWQKGKNRDCVFFWLINSIII